MGFVYFIQHGNTNYMKIGKTDGPIKNRIRGLQTGNPQGLTIFASIEVSSNKLSREELKAHNYFKDHLLHDEWYEFEDFNVIEEYIETKNGQLLDEDSRRDPKLKKVLTVFGKEEYVKDLDNRPPCSLIPEYDTHIMDRKKDGSPMYRKVKMKDGSSRNICHKVHKFLMNCKYYGKEK